jgi:hypothetical protein
MGRIDWTSWDHLLGQLTDPELARRIGCSQSAVMARRQKLGLPAADPRPGWTPADDLRLTDLWGHHGIDVIAKRLKRTPGAVRRRAVLDLHLGPMAVGRMTCAEAARYSGWDREALQRAARALGLRWRTQPVSKPELVGKRRRVARQLMAVEQVDRLVVWLTEHGGRREGYAAPIPGGRKRLIAERAWLGRVCRDCGCTWDVAEGRRRGNPPVHCDACRAQGRGWPLARQDERRIA